MNETIDNKIKLDELYKLLIDQSPFQVTFFDLDLKMLYVNEFSRQFIGRELDEIYATSVLEFMPPEKRDDFKELISKISIENPVGKIENQIINNKGQARWYLWHDKGVFNTAGKLIGYQSIGQDITEKKKIEKDLALNRNRLSEAQRIGRMGGWEWNIKKDQTYWSDETFRLLGLEPGEIEPNQSFYRSTIIAEDLDFFLMQHDNISNNKNEDFNFEYRIINREKKIRWIRDRGKIEYVNGLPVKSIGTILDITESKELQISLEEHIISEDTLLEISNIFMLAEKEKTGSAIKETMKILGTRFDADRVYLVLTDTNMGEIYQWNSKAANNTGIRWEGHPNETPTLLKLLNSRQNITIPATASWPEKKDYYWSLFQNSCKILFFD